MRYSPPASRRARLRAASSETLRPRYSVSMAASAESRRSRTSRTTATFSALGLSTSPPRRRLGRPPGAVARERTPWSQGVRLVGRARSPFDAAPSRAAHQMSSASNCVVEAVRVLRARSHLLVCLPQPGRIDPDAGAHRRRERDGAYVAALGGRRLGPLELIGDR